MRQRFITTTGWLRFLLIQLLYILTLRVYFGRAPERVPGRAIIFFPYMSNRLSCGFTGIVAFNRDRSSVPSIDTTKIVGMVDRIRSCTFDVCADLDTASFSKQYLGGEKNVQQLLDAARELKEDAAFRSIVTDAQVRDALKSIAGSLSSLITDESAHQSEQMGVIATDRFEILSERIERLKDATWCIRMEILDNVEKVMSLLASSQSNPAPFSVSAARQINAVLNSIDRLEVRGRDSAGISLMFILTGDEYQALENELAAGTLLEDFESRANRDVLLNRSISIHRSDRNTAITLTYKVAAEIGSLGDNIRFLRDQIHADPIFPALVVRPSEFFTVLAHTRWASVGAINEANCHPVDNRTNTTASDDLGIIHVCLNGDIDNYQSLMAEHTKAGVRFPEEITCDTKIIPVQIAHYVRQGYDIGEAFRLAVNDFDGSHAIAMHSDLAPGKFFLALKGSGQAIFVGLAPDHYMPTSEVYGFVEETSRFLKLDGETVHHTADGRSINGQIFTIDQAKHGELGGIAACFYDGSPIALSREDVRHTQLISRDIDRQDFNHYFLKEISEAPGSVRQTLVNRWNIVQDANDSRYEITLNDACVPANLKSALIDKGIRQILFIGQGTAGVAALACANLLKHYLQGTAIRIEALKSSELSGFILHDAGDVDMSDTLLIPISQSGTTTDTNRTVDMVRRKGAWVISIVNRRDSDLTFKSDGVIYTSSGRDIEMSVASTKAFYSQIIAGAVLGLFIAQITESRNRAFISHEVKEMIRLPDHMETVLSMTDQIRASAQRLALLRPYWAAVGSGPNKAAADEIRIKLSELCYKTISSDYVEDKKHIDLSSEPLIIICAAGTRRNVIGDIVKDTAIFKSHKAVPIVIADSHEDRFNAYAEDVFHVPAVNEHFAPILNTLVGHIWGYYAALTINDGSRFLHEFREELHELIRSFSDKGHDIFEIALEESIREKILRFYRELRQRQSEQRVPSTIGIRNATDLTLLLKYLAGRLPVNDFEFDFGIKGTAKNMFALLFEALGNAINSMARPVDAIKHQAKTVTVGTSRIEEKTEGILFDLLGTKGFGVEQLTLSNIMVMRNLQNIISDVRGTTLYRVSGINLLGEPTDQSTITVLEKQGTSANIASRSESDQTLKGTKKIIVRQGNVYIGKGRKDERSILILPVLSDDPTRPNTVEYLLLLEIDFRTDVDLPTKIKALGGKYEHIKNLVQESSIAWQDAYIEHLAINDLFGLSAEKIAETIVQSLN